MRRWLCNLGWHAPNRRAPAGRVDYFDEPGLVGRVSLSYLRCRRCGNYFPGSFWRRTMERFP